MKKILSFNQIQKPILLFQNLNLHLPISLGHKKIPSQSSSQTQSNKASGSQPRSKSRTADSKEKNGKEKQKDTEKGPNPYSKGASADPIKVVNRFDSLENMELDSSMFGVRLLHVLADSDETKGLSSLF